MLENFSENDTLALAASLATSDKTFTEAQIEALVGNLPENYSVPIDKLTALANAISLTCFDSTTPADLVNLIRDNKLKVNTMDDSRKIYIGTTVFFILF